MSKRSGAQRRRARLRRTEPPPTPPPKFGTPAKAASKAPPMAEVKWTQLQIDKVFEKTVRSLLQVPANELEDLSALQIIDERLDEHLLARSAKLTHLGPRGGLSDAQRVLRWLRLNPNGVQDVLQQAQVAVASTPRPTLSRQQRKTIEKRRVAECDKTQARAERRALSFSLREDIRMR
jgi:hypothetical protein